MFWITLRLEGFALHSALKVVYIKRENLISIDAEISQQNSKWFTHKSVRYASGNSTRSFEMDFFYHVKNWIKNIFILVTTLRPASPGFATWRRGPIGVFCHFGDFLPIWRFWQLFGDFFGSFWSLDNLW